jgi:hypothetical protein
MIRKLVCTSIAVYLLGLFFAGATCGQEVSEEEIMPGESLAAEKVGYLGIHIGMSRDEVLLTAEANALITVPKNRDVDFFPIEEREIITLSVKPEIPFIYLQFFDDVLYAITVIFDERYMDYHTLSSALAERYGEYSSLTPQWRQWRLERVTVKVEKPAVVKYIALHELLRAASFEGKVSEFDMEKRQTLLNGL